MDRVERLAWMLEEHECLDHQDWLVKSPLPDASWAQRVVRAALANPGSMDRALVAVNAAIAEIESGAIFGAPGRCAVCGGRGTSGAACGVCARSVWFRPVSSEGTRSGVALMADNKCMAYMHRALDETAHMADDGRHIRIILRARKLYREAEPPIRLSANVLPGTPSLPPHLAAAPSESVASERRREHHAPTTPPAADAPPPCWKCGEPIGKVAWSLPFVLQHAPDGGLDTRLVCGPCRDAMYLWVNADNEASTVREMADEDARAREDARKERRRRVLLGLERGDDPRLIGGVCSPWTFDPWRRG